MQRINTKDDDFDTRLKSAIQDRGSDPHNPEIAGRVESIIQTIRRQGDKALLSYAKQWDGISSDAVLTDLEVSADEMDDAWKQVSTETIAALQCAAERIHTFHVKQREQGWSIDTDDGSRLAHRIVPLNRVGIYVPGGTAAYPSSVLMNAIPAHVAGVSEIIMTTPSPQGPIAPAVLAAARIAKVDRVFRIGGAQAVAAMAHGTSLIPKVDKIVGPGNVWVATAKRQVFGTVDIDMIAGPSEICVLATRDGGATAEHIAADLLSQAEHDTQAMACLISPDETFIEEILSSIEYQLDSLPRAEIARESIEKVGLAITVDHLEQAKTVIENIAPEHLELIIPEPDKMAASIRNASAIFCGPHTPEAVGDYIAGPNHVLPTSGSARFFSPLGVYDFVKRINIVRFSHTLLRELGPAIVHLAEIEGLDGHAQSVRARLERPETEGS